MNRIKYLMNNMLLFTIGNIGSKLIIFILLPIYTVSLTTEQYGIVELLQSTLNILVPILTLGLSDASLRFSMEKNTSKSQVLTFPLIILSVGTVLLFLLSSLSIKMGLLNDYKIILFYFPALYFFTAGRNILSQFSRGLGLVKLYVFDNILNSIILVIGTLFFIGVINLNIQGFIISLLLANAVSFIALAFKGDLIKFIKFDKNKLDIPRAMINYSLPLVPNSMSWWITNLSDRIFVTYYSGLDINGLYSIAYKVPSIINLISSTFIQAWQLSVIQEYDSDDKSEFYSTTYDYFTSILYVLASLLILFNKFIASILYRNDFFVAWKYVPILLVAFLVANFHSFLGTVFTAAKETKQLFFSTTYGAIANIILNIILIPKYNAYGAAIATLLSYIVVYIFRIVELKKILNVYINHKKIILLFIVIIVQSFVQITDVYGQFYFGIICFIVIVGTNFKNIYGVSSKFRNVIRR